MLLDRYKPTLCRAACSLSYPALACSSKNWKLKQALAKGSLVAEIMLPHVQSINDLFVTGGGEDRTVTDTTYNLFCVACCDQVDGNHNGCTKHRWIPFKSVMTNVQLRQLYCLTFCKASCLCWSTLFCSVVEIWCNLFKSIQILSNLYCPLSSSFLFVRFGLPLLH